MSKQKVRVFQDFEALTRASGRIICGDSTGGSGRKRPSPHSPLRRRHTSGALSSVGFPAYAAQIDWARTHVFWGDERLVPPDDPGSNCKMAYDALLAHVPLPPENIHRAEGELEAETAVTRYTQELGANGSTWASFPRHLIWRSWDWAATVHTASFFLAPSPLLKEPNR
ncbi:MAG: 6-phosphogluconolactonase [Chloroflexi bacterium]|nr:6-phosphogluconolactonase [Chloroflexota bacterium]